MPQEDTNQGHISVLYNSAKSMMSKRNEPLAYIANEESNIIAIVEICANSSHVMTEFSIAG